jgi:hypothetical protein
LITVGRGYFKHGNRDLSVPDEGRQIRLRTADGYEVGAVFYAAPGPRRAA